MYAVFKDGSEIKMDYKDQVCYFTNQKIKVGSILMKLKLKRENNSQSQVNNTYELDKPCLFKGNNIVSGEVTSEKKVTIISGNNG